MNHFLNLNNKLSREIQLSLPVIIKSLGKTKFKYTSEALASFIPKSGYVNSSILASCASRNVYASAILFRSMIEHKFRHLYIYVRALNDDSDDIGKRYYKTLKANENLESFTKVNNYNKAVYPEKTKWNTRGEHNKAISEDAKEFRIDKIFYYLIASNNMDDKTKVVERFKKEYLLNRLVEYTNLSSAVHGGPSGEAILTKLYKNKKTDEQLNSFAVDSIDLHKSIVETTYLFAYLMDEKMQKYYEKIKSIGDVKR